MGSAVEIGEAQQQISTVCLRRRPSATSLQDLLVHMVDGVSSQREETGAENERPHRRQLSATSLQTLLDQVEDGTGNVGSGESQVSPHINRHLSRNHSTASLQRMLDATDDPDSPSLVPPSGVYSTTPVASVRTAVLSASFRELLGEVNDETPRIPRPPLMRRESSKENLVSALDDALDAIDLSKEKHLESSRRELAEALDDVLDAL